MGKKSKAPDQEIYIWSPPKGAGRQEVYVNPPDGRPPDGSPSSPHWRASSSTPHYAPGTERLGIVTLLLIAIIGVAALVVACGVASALTAGSVW